MPKHGKRYNTAVAEFDRNAPVALAEAVTRVKQNATAKFDETVELHIRTGLDPRHADQQVRGTTNLPHGLGKTVRVAVFAEGEAARDAEEAGAMQKASVLASIGSSEPSWQWSTWSCVEKMTSPALTSSGLMEIGTAR